MGRNKQETMEKYMGKFVQADSRDLDVGIDNLQSCIKHLSDGCDAIEA